MTTFRAMFRRHRRPGDIVFAWVALLVSAFLLWHLTDQTAWRKGGALFAQPRFWPAVSLGGMTAFAALHLLGSACSERLPGRWREVGLWLRALEYAGWFVAYAALVPWAGYLPSTLLFALLLTLRAGYRGVAALGSAALGAVIVVAVFRGLLRVNLPAGRAYETLPDGLRQIMLTWF